MYFITNTTSCLSYMSSAEGGAGTVRLLVFEANGLNIVSNDVVLDCNTNDHCNQPIGVAYDDTRSKLYITEVRLRNLLIWALLHCTAEDSDKPY